MRKDEGTYILTNRFFVALLLIIFAFLAYSNSINSSFHFDDVPNITMNRDVLITDLSLDSLKKAASSNEANLRSIPLLSFAINYYISGFDTTSYHVVNLIIHIINAFLIYLIILKMFAGDSADDERKRPLALSALFTALVWLVIPVNSQAVILIVQRMTLLTTLFFLSSFLSYLLGRQRAETKFYILSAIFFILSILSKENSITFPIIIVIYELIFIRKGDVKSVTKRDVIFLLAFLFAMLLPALIYSELISGFFADSQEKFGFTASERFLTQFRVHILYLSLLVLPLPGRLSITHDIAPSSSIFSPFSTFVSLIILLALFALSIVRLKKSPYLSFAILFFIIMISLEAVIPLEMVYEHRIYLPGIFLIAAAVRFLFDRLYIKNGKAVVVAFFAVSLVFTALTAVRGKAWESETTLWRDVVQKYPEDGRAHYSLGTAYIMEGMNTEAERHLSKAIEKMLENLYESKKFKLVMAYENLGIAQSRQRKYYKAEENFLKAIEYDNERATAYDHLGSVYFMRKEYKRALDMYKRALEVMPGLFTSTKNAGLAYQMLEDHENALKYFKEALSLNQNDPDLRNMIRLAEKRLGNR